VQIQKTNSKSEGKKYFLIEERKEIARAYLYLLYNAQHEKPFGFIEDLWVSEKERGKGMGTQIIKLLIEDAKKAGCYKLICTSRHERKKVHALYEKMGFRNHGNEYRMEFE
jgi:GNAT superfamily N-acetyltransferase